MGCLFIPRAMAIVLISGLFILLILFLLSLTEHAPFLPILFKVVSVFGTVGLSMSLTLDLSEFGKWVIMCVMFFGKVGMLTLTFSIARRSHVDIRYPNGRFIRGEVQKIYFYFSV
ncbi:MAG: Ktr system potassium transporter [Sporolactobacillus laevolacticus]|nr:Ktr system potassium transporter [Sporolactobacillus laevolacticus]